MHTMDYINHSITLTIYTDEATVSRILSKQEIIIMMGYMGVAYDDETSLFCTACNVFRNMETETLLLFLDYAEEDWDSMLDYVDEHVPPLNLVSCRKN